MDMFQGKYRHLFICVVLGAMVLAVYWQVGEHSFIYYDDDEYVFNNRQVQGGLSKEGISWAFKTFHAANWHPLTWLSHMTDVQLFGLDAGWHHRVNVLFHMGNTCLLFLLLWRMTGGFWQSAFVAALFGVHPLHVETVAWVAERKDLLSTLFWLLTTGAYLNYVRNPGVGRYLLMTMVFAMGLMCKPMLVTLPFVLLLLDWWPLRRLSSEDSPGSGSLRLSMPLLCRRVREKAPLLLLSAISCVMTVLAQAEGGSVPHLEHLSFGWRTSNAMVSYVVYLGKMAYPVSLGVFYPHPASINADIPAWEVAGASLALLGISFAALRQGDRRPYLAVGWLWYIGTLVPVIGLFQVGGQAFADRYTYIPLIGIFIAIAWGIHEAAGKWRLHRYALGAMGVAILLALGVSAWNQAGYWKDSITLFRHTLEVTEKNGSMWNNLGVAYEHLGQPQQAIDSYREVLRIHPRNFYAWYNLGVVHNKLGQHRQAIDCFLQALRIRPDSSEAWCHVGVANAAIGKPQQAVTFYQEALRLKPTYDEAWRNLGTAYRDLGRFSEAIAAFREALRLNPEIADSWYNLGICCSLAGQHGQAYEVYQRLHKLNPAIAGKLYQNADLRKYGYMPMG